MDKLGDGLLDRWMTYRPNTTYWDTGLRLTRLDTWQNHLYAIGQEQWIVCFAFIADRPMGWQTNQPINQLLNQPTDCYTWVDSWAVAHATKKLSFYLHEMHGMRKTGINQSKSYKTHLQSTITPKWCKSLISCKSEVKELIVVCILNP